MKLAFASKKFLVKPKRTIAELKYCIQKAILNLGLKVQASKRTATRAVKDIVIPSLPFVSKVKLPKAPVPHLLYSNIQPTESERALIRAAITAAEVESELLKQK